MGWSSGSLLYRNSKDGSQLRQIQHCRANTFQSLSKFSYLEQLTKPLVDLRLCKEKEYLPYVYRRTLVCQVPVAHRSEIGFDQHSRQAQACLSTLSSLVLLPNLTEQLLAPTASGVPSRRAEEPMEGSSRDNHRGSCHVRCPAAGDHRCRGLGITTSTSLGFCCSSTLST